MHPSVDTMLVYILANAAINMGVQISLRRLISSLDIDPRVSGIAILLLILFRNFPALSTVAALTYIPTNTAPRSPFFLT